MKILVQRVAHANCKVDGKITGEIGKGFLLFVGVGPDDTKEIADYLVKKVCNLRIFEDKNEKMNLNINDVGGELLIISQFTLYADTEHGNRPSFINAAKPDKASELYDYFCDECEKTGIKVGRGIFGADMKIDLLNDGPVTIMLEK